MATAAVTNTFVTATTASSAAVNTNFNDLVTFLNGSVVHRDGSKAMTGSLDLGGNDLLNVGALDGAIVTSGMDASTTLAAAVDVFETIDSVTLGGDAGAKYLVIASCYINAAIAADVMWTARLNPSVDAVFANTVALWNGSQPSIGGTVRLPMTIVGVFTASAGSQDVYFQFKRNSTSGTQLVVDHSITAIRYE